MADGSVELRAGRKHRVRGVYFFPASLLRRAAVMCVLEPMSWLIARIFGVLSCEWLLFRCRNGGAVIGFRSAVVSAFIFGLALGMAKVCDWCGVPTESLQPIQWFGAIFAATYFAFYSRFASQWAYLAGVYNQIKEAECNCRDRLTNEALAEWKAAFITDCHALHLAGKPDFAATIRYWALDDLVREKFGSSLSEKKRLAKILDIADRAQRW
jgi:hypothetical protein